MNCCVVVALRRLDLVYGDMDIFSESNTNPSELRYIIVCKIVRVREGYARK